MATDVKADLIQESALEQGEDGSWSQTRMYRVNGLDADPSIRFYQAITASGIPAHNALHPSLLFLRVKTRRVRPLGKAATAALVTIGYRSGGSQSDPPAVGETSRLSIGASIEQVLTNVDKNGTVLTHEYTDFPTAYPQVQTDRVIPFLRYSQRESSTTTAMATKVRTYSGRVNSTTFLGAAARTLKAAINADYVYTDESGNLIFDVNYELYYAAETWDAVTRYDGKDGSGDPPSDLSTSLETLKTHTVLPEVNFSGMGIV